MERDPRIVEIIRQGAMGMAQLNGLLMDGTGVRGGRPPAPGGGNGFVSSQPVSYPAILSR